jgi:hypothetical protein
LRGFFAALDFFALDLRAFFSTFGVSAAGAPDGAGA